MRFYQKQLKDDSRAQKEGTTEASKILYKRAQDQHQEDLKRAKLYATEKRLAAQNEDEKKAFAERAEEAKLAQQTKLIEAIIARRDHDASHKEKQEKRKDYHRWLQTMYPANLADRCITVF